MPYDPTVASISNRISALGNTPAPIHFTLCIVRHIDYSEPIEHSVDVGHAPDIAQRFWTVYHCSDLFYIAQRQQHRAPRQTFAVFPAVDHVVCTHTLRWLFHGSLQICHSIILCTNAMTFSIDCFSGFPVQKESEDCYGDSVN